MIHLLQKETLPLDRLALIWVNVMIHHAQKLATWETRGLNLPAILHDDQFQFKAIRHQLQMLLCTRPTDPWGSSHWLQNFTPFLTQLRRRSQQYLQHLYELLAN